MVKPVSILILSIKMGANTRFAPTNVEKGPPDVGVRPYFVFTRNSWRTTYLIV
jgi:hypothetical protein